MLKKLKLLSLQKNQIAILIIKNGFGRCTFPGFYYKIVKQYGLIFPFVQYQGSSWAASKINYSVSCSKVSSSDHQTQDTTTTDSGLRCFSGWLLLSQLWHYPYLLLSKQQVRRPLCKVQMLHLIMECLLFILRSLLNSGFRSKILGEMAQ